MKETMTVQVNGRPVEIYCGLTVKHALIALNQALYEKALAGEVVVRDENGFVLGLDGGLCPGAKLYTKKANPGR